MTTIIHQDLPRTGHEREALRGKGQFWTPLWVAESMVAYALGAGGNTLFDPAVGEGAFFKATKAIERLIGRQISLSGTEIDPEVIKRAVSAEITVQDISNVQIRDFIMNPPAGPFRTIVANPPYLRHHRLSDDMKYQIKLLATRMVGTALDGRAGLHIFFLLQALDLLAEGGRLAFIMPADTCEGMFAKPLWKWITENYRLDAVVTFDSNASPFPKVDTNAVVFLISRERPTEFLCWARVNQAWTDELTQWTLSNFQNPPGPSLLVINRRMIEALETGLSRTPSTSLHTGPLLGEYAKVTRGIATGANEFFFLTQEQANSLQIPNQFFLPAIGRTRDVITDEITDETMANLAKSGRPTRLLSLDNRPKEQFPISLQNYLQVGEAAEYPRRSLIKQRRPWYKMEVRRPPAFLFCYLGRRNVRFIRNTAGVMPLTGFLCIYPHNNNPDAIERLWQVLQHSDTIANLARVGKSYGGGAIKVEPRSLEKLPLPADIVKATGLQPTTLNL